MTRIKKYSLVFLLFIVSVFLYKYSPYRVEFIGNYHKIWAHRVDSKEKLKAALLFYDGVELDLVFKANENVLDVNHPPTKSINLSFENYLSEIENEPYLWLDIKNLTAENSELILSKLIKVLNKKKYSFKKVLIETRYPEALPIFTKEGFITSYYLPFGLHNKSVSELNIEITKIKSVLKNQPEIGISSDYKDYNILKKHFPDKNKYLWMISSITERGFAKTRSILKDEKVKVVLVHYKSPSGNR
ncbi:MAG: hypothetical protein L3J09_10825 [Flavobacteriaceae bacterium]|nr:hypothetical protein [Flavobacteriaceae bacterium]